MDSFWKWYYEKYRKFEKRIDPYTNRWWAGPELLFVFFFPALVSFGLTFLWATFTPGNGEIAMFFFMTFCCSFSLYKLVQFRRRDKSEME
ncbi:MAG: hypothetical protein AAGJ74_13890 [Pseudomonadota bacterium]